MPCDFVSLLAVLLQGKLALTGEASPVESLASAVLDSGQCQTEVDLLTRAKATALLGNPDLATQARQHLSGQSSLPSGTYVLCVCMCACVCVCV